MARTNSPYIFLTLKHAYDELKINAETYDQQRSEHETLQRKIQLTQGRLQQSENLVSSLITQAIEETLGGEIGALLTTIQSRIGDKHLMIQAIPANDTIWLASVMVADLFQQVDLPNDRPIKAWIFDPKQRLGNQYDLSGALLRTGSRIPGINVEYGVQAQFAINVLDGSVVIQSNYMTPFDIPAQPTTTTEIEPIVEGEVVTNDPTHTDQETLTPNDIPGTVDEDQH